MGVHLTADVILGLFLIASPWLFQFSDSTYLFHVIIGLVALIAGIFTNREPAPLKYNKRSVNKRSM